MSYEHPDAIQANESIYHPGKAFPFIRCNYSLVFKNTFALPDNDRHISCTVNNS